MYVLWSLFKLVAQMTAACCRKKTVQFQVSGSGGIAGSIISLWGPKAAENIVPLNLTMTVQPESGQLKRNRGHPRQCISATMPTQ
jgi:hypothetical protein